MDDVLIIGGGVIGLSLGYELSRRGQRVRVVDRTEPATEASWAGAGILPPAVMRAQDHPLKRLTGLSHQLHAHWAAALREQTGIDTGYLRCGGLYLSRSTNLAEEQESASQGFTQSGIEARWLSPEGVHEIEPRLAAGCFQGAWHLPDECQLRNPRHVRALLHACRQQGVEIVPCCPIDDFVVRKQEVEAVACGGLFLRARQFCIAGGAWSGGLLSRLGISVPIKPVRGQMVLLNGARMLHRVINDGRRYLVPRPDGRVLVGSTEEDVGFDKRTTAQAIGDLLHFALQTVPDLHAHQVERTWAGLRPASGDDFPYLGRLPGLENAFVAAGHYRQGLHLSPGTAVVMSQLMRGETPQIDLTPFSVDRT